MLTVDAVGDSTHPTLDEARRAYASRAWNDAASMFARVDAEARLGCDDLELWASASGLSGDDEAMIAVSERVYRELEGVDDRRAAHAAFWAGFRLLARGEIARGGGWLARARRLVERLDGDCVVEGYLELSAVGPHLRARALDEAYAAAGRAAAIGERHRDADLVALARQHQGRIRLRQEHLREGLALLDETMLAATSGELSPAATGLVYCGAIHGCRSVYALDRAREWTAALRAWCDAQPQLAPFSGACSILRAELLELGGAWAEAIEEIGRIGAYQARAEPGSVGDARYREGEIHRLRGESDRADAAYRAASADGRDPQPGQALLRLGQGRTEAAMTAIRRAVDSLAEPLDRVRLLPALVEIAVAAGRVEEAREGARELEAIAARCESAVLQAMADEAQGAIALVQGDPPSALRRLRAAFEVWQRVGAPYHAARLRVATARACRALGDAEGATLELEAAGAVFRKLGAAPPEPEVRRVEHGLSARELQVLRLIAGGKANKEIAAELSLSVKTVDRHVSNIFAKIAVTSRAAATAYAFQHGLMGNIPH
jgi:DNA-binding NarL/FixJ family response regulator